MFNVKEGWKPLCRFLEVDIPDKPFPHKNKQARIIDELMATNPSFIRMQREMMASVGLVTIVVAYGCYRFFKSNASTSVFCWPSICSFSSSIKFW